MTHQPDNTTRQPYISKSAFLMGLQCRKLIWFRYNARDQIPAPDEETQAVFDQGAQVGELARGLFPGGLVVAPGITDADQALAETREAIQSRRPLFEAAFLFNGGYARTDVLNPVSEDAWDLIEVKSTTELKDEHLPDIAFQAYVLAGAGIKLRNCWLAHINSDFIRRGPIDPRQIFTLEDVTGKALALSRDVAAQLDAMQNDLGLPAHPEIQIGPHCDKPYRCPLHDHCWSFLPEASVFTLYAGGKKRFALFEKGIHHLAEIPNGFPLTDRQEIQRAVQLSGQPHVDRSAIAAFLKQLEYPVSYLDFETFNPAIPLLDETRPFQQVPFQFSLHVVRSENAKPEHHSFLADRTADPRPEFMRQLRDALPETGSVVIYNATFEKTCLKEGCEFLPEFRPWFRKLMPRIVDLLLPFREFLYYHPRQHGSGSMKHVLPAMTGRGYEHLDIQEGGTASQEFLRVTFGDVSMSERAKIRTQLEEYCGLDTMGMLQIVKQLCLFGQT